MAKLRVGNLYMTGNIHGKNGFVTATKIGTTNIFFVAATKNFAVATKRFVDRTKHFVVVTKYFCYPYFNKLFCWYNKTFYTVYPLLLTQYRPAIPFGNRKFILEDLSFEYCHNSKNITPPPWKHEI